MNQRVRLYPRKGIWWASWTANGVTVARSTRTRTEAEARSVVDSWTELPVKREVLRREEGRVYFVEAEGTNLIKIGFTRTSGMKRRLEHLRCDCPVPVHVLGGYRGTMATEREEHRRWAHERIRGEWFRGSQSLRVHIKDVSEWAPRREALVRHGFPKTPPPTDKE